MRVIAYFAPSIDVRAAHDELLTRAGVDSVACRSGHAWNHNSRPERGFDAVHAPGYPEIRAAYSAIDINDVDGNPTPCPFVTELSKLQHSDVVTIVCPGLFVRDELAWHEPDGPVIAVNEAAPLVRHDYFLANDGFILWLADIKSEAIRVCRRAQRNTLPTCLWFPLDEVGVINGQFSSRAALTFAVKALRAKRIVLIGHDCEDTGTGTRPWDDGHIELCRNSMASDMVNLSAAGTTIDHVRWDGSKTYIQTYAPPEVSPAKVTP